MASTSVSAPENSRKCSRCTCEEPATCPLYDLTGTEAKRIIIMNSHDLCKACKQCVIDEMHLNQNPNFASIKVRQRVCPVCTHIFKTMKTKGQVVCSGCDTPIFLEYLKLEGI